MQLAFMSLRCWLLFLQMSSGSSAPAGKALIPLPDIISDKIDLVARGFTETRCGHGADKYALEDTVDILYPTFPFPNY